MEYIEILNKEKDLVKLISFDSAYPGNIKSNIAIYNSIKDKYELDIDKKTFMALVKLYMVEGNIDKAYCKICGKLCNPKTDYSFHETCSKECGVKLASQTRSIIYHNMTEDKKQAIKNKRRQTNLDKYGVSTNLQNKAVVESRIEKYGANTPFASKGIRDKIKQNNMESHDGLANPFQWEECKIKSQSTKLEKYGNKNYNNIERMKATNIEKYEGIGWGSSKINDKIKKTNLERYGVEYAQQSELIKDKVRKTNKERYGVDAPLQNEEIRKKSIATSLEKYGVEWNCMSQQCRIQSGTISQINLKWKQDFEELGYEVVLEKSINRSGYDLYLPEKNLFIEINPTITHQSTTEINTHFGKIHPRERLYHRNKSTLARENGYDCFMIWDWDDPQKVLNSFVKKDEVKLKDCIIKEVNDIKIINEYLNNWHYQGTCKGQNICIGLYYKDELISLMTFGKSRYNKKFQYEWLRYTSSKIVHRGVSAMFKYFVDKYNPESIISYCDKSKFNGKMFEYLNFICNKQPNPSCHYYNTKTFKHYTLNEVNKLGACRILDIPQIDRSTGKTNNDIMLENGYLEVYDCGQATYVWHRE